MSSWEREVDPTFRGWAIAATVAGIALIAWVALLGSRARQEPSRCPSGFVVNHSRCCAPGQGVSRGACVGAPELCPRPAHLASDPSSGCVVSSTRVLVTGGSVTLGPTDWDTADVLQGRIVAVRSFEIDSLEVTAYRYRQCEKAGLCENLDLLPEPGLPVVNISVPQAEKFCAFAGGRLPSPHEWIYAASGSEARRFPWGAHGLVCRRSAFGLVTGPCARDGVLPELAGMRPDGATPDGVFDLSGNVAEWAITPDGQASLHGGSFRSQQAGQLKSWSTSPARKGNDVGFRCVYPVR